MGKLANFTVVFFMLAFAGVAQASSGGVNAAGCHQSKTEGYHCHEKRGKVQHKMQRTGGGESVTARERRLKRECRGMPNAGACLGYAR